MLKEVFFHLTGKSITDQLRYVVKTMAPEYRIKWGQRAPAAVLRELPG